MLLLQILFAVTAAETLMIRAAFKASPLRQIVRGHAVIRKLSISAPALSFYEAEKSGRPRRESDPEYSPYEHWRDGIKLVGGEVAKFKEEVIWKFRCDHVVGMQHGDYEVVWKFDNKETIDSWIVTTDKDNNEGYSTAELVMTPNHHGLFRGHLDTTVPKDGIIKHTGYCNIQSPPNFVWLLIHFSDTSTFHFCTRKADPKSYPVTYLLLLLLLLLSVL